MAAGVACGPAGKGPPRGPALEGGPGAPLRRPLSASGCGCRVPL